MIPLVLVLTLVIYLVYSGMDLIRYHLFRKLKAKQRLGRLEKGSFRNITKCE